MTATTLWRRCGGQTPTSLQPVFALTETATTVRAAFSTTSGFGSPIYSAPVAPDANLIVRPGDVSGLTANVRYYYCAEIDGVLDTANAGRARTLPTTPTTIRFTFASCWAGYGHSLPTTPDHAIGGFTASLDRLFHLFTGDFGYDPNIATDNATEDQFRANFANMLAIPNVANLFGNVAVNQMIDDHDGGKDNCDRTSPGFPAMRSTFRQCVPHYPMPDPNALYYSAVVGNVRFVFTDLRSNRSPDTDPDDASKTMLGATQKAWLKAEWLAAKNAGQLICWVGTQEWPIDGVFAVAGLNTDNDHWGGFPTERRELDNFRSAHRILDIIGLGGDGHSNTFKRVCDYSDAQDAPMPFYSSAAMSRAAAYRPAAWDYASPPVQGDGHVADMTITMDPVSGWRVNCDFYHVDPVTGAGVVEFAAPTIGFSLPPVLTPVTPQGLSVFDGAGVPCDVYTMAAPSNP